MDASLRVVAEAAGVTVSELSAFEMNQRIPTNTKLMLLTSVLSLDAAPLMALAANGREARPIRSPIATIPIDQRFERLSRQARNINGCLVMPGNPNTYPSIGNGRAGEGQQRMSHVAWSIANKRPVPSGLWVLHHCDNRRCIKTEPDKKYPEGHLYIGNRAQNIADMVRRDRTGRRRHPESWTHRSYSMRLAKLDWDAVDAIRSASGRGATYKDLATTHGVSPNTIWRIVSNRTWRHETRP